MTDKLKEKIEILEKKSHKITTGIWALCFVGAVLAAFGIKLQFDLTDALTQSAEAKKVAAQAVEKVRSANEDFAEITKQSIDSVKNTSNDQVRLFNSMARGEFEALWKGSSESIKSLVPQSINCPAPTVALERSGDSFDHDLYQCDVNIPQKGFLYLSLQGHIVTKSANNPCSFGIYVDGKSINSATRNHPSHTYSTVWEPAFMADTTEVSKGKVTVSLRMSGTSCAIHDADINGVFLPTGF